MSKLAEELQRYARSALDGRFPLDLSPGVCERAAAIVERASEPQAVTDTVHRCRLCSGYWIVADQDPHHAPDCPLYEPPDAE